MKTIIRSKDGFRLLTLAVAIGACGGSSGSPGASSPLATAFCDKVEVCEGRALSPADRQTCLRVASMAFAIPPDPDSAVACLTNTSCTDLMADPEGVTNACLDIDPSACRILDIAAIELAELGAVGLVIALRPRERRRRQGGQYEENAFHETCPMIGAGPPPWRARFDR